MSSCRFQLLVNLLRNAFVLLHREREGAFVQGCVRKYGKSSAREGRLSFTNSVKSWQKMIALTFHYFCNTLYKPKVFTKYSFKLQNNDFLLILYLQHQL